MCNNENASHFTTLSVDKVHSVQFSIKHVPVLIVPCG